MKYTSAVGVIVGTSSTIALYSYDHNNLATVVAAVTVLNLLIFIDETVKKAIKR